MKIRAFLGVAGIGLLLAACSSPTAPRLPPADDDQDPRGQEPPAQGFMDQVPPGVTFLLA